MRDRKLGEGACLAGLGLVQAQVRVRCEAEILSSLMPAGQPRWKRVSHLSGPEWLTCNGNETTERETIMLIDILVWAHLQCGFW